MLCRHPSQDPRWPQPLRVAVQHAHPPDTQLRHTYASLLINQGESIKYASRQLGHASIQITADLYGHLFKETSVEAMRRLERSIPKHKDRERGESMVVL